MHIILIELFKLPSTAVVVKQCGSLILYWKLIQLTKIYLIILSTFVFLSHILSLKCSLKYRNKTPTNLV